MADTPNNGETVTNQTLKNEGQTGSTGNGDGNAPDSAAEQLKKQLEQAQMRERQLQNEIDKNKKAEEERKRKELEDKEEWKAIAEREREQREALEAKEAEAHKRQELETAQTSILQEFPDEVIEIAKDAGLGLADDSEASQEKLRSTLQKLQDKIGAKAKVAPNNRGVSNNMKLSREELIREAAKSGNSAYMDEAINSIGWIQSNQLTHE